MSSPVSPIPLTTRPPVDWKRNLVALWIAEFTAIFGFSFVQPFLPVFIGHELHISGQSQVSLWSGIAGSASGVALAIASPLWGIAADRYGRKAMLLRAMFAGSVVLTLMAFSRNVVDLTVLRLMQGAFTGTIAAAIALVATETPRDKVGWAMGVLSSAIAMGTAIGPFVGGITATAFGLRPTFAGGGILLLLSTIPVIAMVRDSRRAKGDDPIGSAIQLIRARPGALRAIAIIVVAQGLLQFGFSASQQLVVVRLLALIPTQVTSVTGIAFGTSGLFSALAAVTYAKIAHRFGYRPTVVGAACCLAGTMVAMAIAPAAALVVAAIATFGLLFGALSPAMSTMLGLEAPRAVQARVFGISASALAVGIALGPLSCGALASMTSPQIGLLLAASSAVVLAVLMGTQGREPAR